MSFLQWQRRARSIAARIDAPSFREIVARRAALALAVEALVARAHGTPSLHEWRRRARDADDSAAHRELSDWLCETLGDPALDDELAALAQRHHSVGAAPFVLEHITHALDPRARVDANLYSTPEPVARWMARESCAAITRHCTAATRLDVIDPASGSGALLVAFAREAPPEVLQRAELYGIERDPVALAAGRIHTQRAIAPRAPGFVCDDALSRPWSEHRAGLEGAREDVRERRTVLLANPPFASSEPMNSWLAALVRGEDPRSKASYRRRDGDPPLRNTKWLDTAQLRFLRWIHEACDEAAQAVAVVALGHAWVDHPTFAPVRRALCESFDEVSVLDLHGAARHGLHTPDGGRDQNLFEIQQGLCLLVLGRGARRTQRALVRRADLWGTRAEKRAALEREDLRWSEVEPSAPAWSYAATATAAAPAAAADEDEALAYDAAPSLFDVFESHGSAIISGRDAAVLAFDRDEIDERIASLARPEHARATLEALLGAKAVAKLDGAEKTAIAAITDKARRGELEVRRWHYRPWDVRFAIDDRCLVDRPRSGSVIDALRSENTLAIVTRRQSPPERPWNYVLVVREPPCDGVLRADPHGTEVVFTRDRIERGALAHNFKTDWLAELGARAARAVAPDQAFAFLVGALMDEGYRARHGARLSKDAPRVLWPRGRDEFEARVAEGARWIRVHTESIDEVDDVTIRGADEGARITCATYDPSKRRIVLGDRAFVDGVRDEDLRTHIGARRPALRWLEDRVGRPITPSLEAEYRRVLGRVRAHVSR
ncbi:MAG: N-6 DNA methylase [Myxococcales bacterium]|nr:N-6 DNA methylase [Myxococcales bacterium]